MSCGCSSVHTPPTITSCNATYNVCTGKSFYINVIGCADPIVTIPTQSDIGYPIVGLLEYSEINKKIYYTHNGSNSGVATTDSFTYTVVCNGISRTCTITVNIDDSISIDTTVVELDGCCIPTYTAKVYGNTVYSVIVDNTNILNTSYTSDTALSTFLNTYINVNGTFTVTKTTVSDVVNWTIVLTSNTKVLNSVTGISLVQAIKTLCGCKLGDVEYTWTIPDCATLVTGYSIHDCKIQVIVPLYDALDDTCCPIDLTVRCGNCTSNCEKTETYNWCPPIYENCQTPDCSLYPCTTYNPISGNCDDICDECDTCCQNESGYYCAECCDNNGCALANCPETSQPICVGQECVCYVNGIEVEPLPNGCCPNCTELTVLPNCHTCVNGIIVAPDTTCPTNTTYNYTTCQCDCDCINGYCYNVLTQICEPCPECVTIAGLYTCNGQPYTTSLVPCTQCINNVIVPNTCASGSIPNPYFNPNNPVSTTNPCCISLTPCDCDNPTCVGQGTICTHIEGSEECYCVDCTSLSCTNTSVICEEVNGCDCVGNTCVSGCPTCTGTVSIQEYCSPFFVKYEGCNNNNDKYRFKVYEVNNLLEKPITGCTYDDYLNIPLSGLTDITNSLLPADLQYNTSSSVFFIDGTLSSNYLVIDKLGVQTMLIKVKKYGIETIYEFVIDGNTCILASEENSDTDLVTPANPRIFRETCKFIYGLKSTGVCPFNDYEWDFEVTEDTDTAIEIQDGKYIVIFPPDFPLGTTREVCVTGKYIYEEVVCYSKEACKDYTPCTGGCGCNPCTDPNSGLQTSIETITDAINGTITASASVLINCNGTLGGVLALCEAANSSENCSPLDNVNNYGTSPLPFSAYDDFNGTPCSLWNCNESDPTGCGTEGQAPCGWLYDDTKLVVDNYNEATIKVSFVDGEVKGKLCWAAKYECGYVCNCIEVDKVINCEDYGITDVSINCTPTPTSTNVGQLIISVNNYSDPYKIEVYKQGTPNTLLGTYPPLPATSIVTSPYTITIPESWGISNGDELIIKVIILVDGLDCNYEESVVYSCCVTPTIGDLSVLCNNNTGEITTVTFTTNTAGNPYNIYINGSTTSVYSGITIVGTNTYIFNQGMPDVTNIKVAICDDNTTDCCAESSINVVCDKNCTITGADIVITCVNGDITSVEIEGSTGTLSDTYTIVITNTSNTAPNTVTKSNQTLPYTLTGGELATLAISDGDIITAVITVTGEPTCTITVTETIDCSIDCNLVVDYPVPTCTETTLEELTFNITGATYPVHVTGNITYDNNGTGNGLGNGGSTVTINEQVNSGNYVLIYLQNGTIIRNCIYGNLTFTDSNGCVVDIEILCETCDLVSGTTYDCLNNQCVVNQNDTGFYASHQICLQSCVNITPEDCLPITGNIEVTAPPIGTNRNIYTPVCNNTLNNNINLGYTNLNNYNFQNDINLPFFNNVVNIAYGYKYSKGKKTDEKAYIYQVTKKVDYTELPKNQIIPKFINNIKTDVVEIETVDLHVYNHLAQPLFNKQTYLNGGTGSNITVLCSGNVMCYDNTNNGVANCNCVPFAAPTGKLSPSHNSLVKSNNTVYGGLGVFVFSNNTVLGGGTIFLVAKENSTGKLVAVVNNHVLGNLVGLSHTIQNTDFNYNYRLGNGLLDYPASCTNWTNYNSERFGVDYKAVAFVEDNFSPANNGTPNYVDIGLINLNPDFAATDIHEIGYGGFEWVTTDMFTDVNQLVGLTVYKSGAVTGTKIAIGEIDSVSVTTTVGGSNRKMVQQIKITPILSNNNCQNIMSLPGDSGSPVLVELGGTLKILGISWGGNPYYNPTPHIMVSPIWKIAELADISAWDGEIVVDSNSPFIKLSKNNRQYVKGQPTNANVTHTSFIEQLTQQSC